MSLRDRIDPVRVMALVFAIIFGAMIIWMFAIEARADYQGELEEPKKKVKVFDHKGYHPLAGTVGMRPSFDIGTVYMTNQMGFTVRVCLALENAVFRACTVLSDGEYIFFYGVESGRNVVAWSALAYHMMDTGAKYMIIDPDDLYRYWFERKMITSKLTNEELVGKNLKFYGIVLTPQIFKRPKGMDAPIRKDRA
jgi:hypothetical protein